jgi:hypothetical protein
MKNNIHFFGVILAIFIVGILIATHVMSAHYPIAYDKVEANSYLEKFKTDSRKTFIYDKNGKVFGYAKKIQQDSPEAVVYDTNDNVKGYLQQDLLDPSKLRFFRVNNYR